MAKRTSKKGADPPLDAAVRVAILHGKEAFLRSAFTGQLRDAHAASGEPVDVLRFDGSEAPLAEILDECRSFGLMSQHKLVVVDNAEALAAREGARPALESYAKAPNETATLVLRAETWRPGNLDKAVKKVGVVKKCEAPDEATASAWARRRAEKRHGVSLPAEAARALVGKLGPDLGRIDAELGKLASAAGAEGSGGVITAELVGELVGFTREEAVWGIQETLLTADAEGCLSKLRELITVSRVSPVLVRYAMVDLARKLHAGSRGLERGTPASVLRKELKLWGPAASAVLGAAGRISPESAASLLSSAVEADAGGKTGAGDEVRGLELLALRFASARG